MPGPRRQDITGQKFSMLTAVSLVRITGSGHTIWRFRCDCGVEKEVRASHAKSGQIKSCGCSSGAMISAAQTTHGYWKGDVSAPEYSAWCLARTRCTNPNNRAFSRYGARGITMCERWASGENGKTGFECFIVDMGDRPSPGHSLDRIDNNKGYSPDNCRWATIEQQQRNMRSNKVVEFRGQSMCVAQAADAAGMPKAIVWQRVFRGWTIDRAVSTPIQVKRRRK